MSGQPSQQEELKAFSVSAEQCQDFKTSSQIEWILPAGKFGFAMGTASGAASRRLHSHLAVTLGPGDKPAAALIALEAVTASRGTRVGISTNTYAGAVHPEGFRRLQSFMAGPACEWVFKSGATSITKRLKMHADGLGCTTTYENKGEGAVQLRIRPLIGWRREHEPFTASEGFPAHLSFPSSETEIEMEEATLTLRHDDAERLPSTGWHYRFWLEKEEEEGAPALDDVYCPCELSWLLEPGGIARITASLTGSRDHIEIPAMSEAATLKDQLCSAASLHVVSDEAGPFLAADLPVKGQRSRDVLIALPGIMIGLGREEEATEMLNWIGSTMKNGALPTTLAADRPPNDFRSCDAGLWLIQAAWQVLQAHWDDGLAAATLTWMDEIIQGLANGCDAGLVFDEVDGLLKLVDDDAGLTWMDSFVDDWPAVYRHGKPIEINALWISGLHIAESICARTGQDGLRWRLQAEKADSNFEKTFWRSSIRRWLDCAEPDDATLRAGIVIALGVPFSPIRGRHAEEALALAARELLTPYGIRSCGPREPNYDGRQPNQVSEVSRLEHNGAVLPWMLGLYAYAVARITRDDSRVASLLDCADEMLLEHGLGGISRLRGGDEPHRPGGVRWHAPALSGLMTAFRVLEESRETALDSLS
jgi:predicted glycogen debranching enzyme